MKVTYLQSELYKESDTVKDEPRRPVDAALDVGHDNVASAESVGRPRTFNAHPGRSLRIEGIRRALRNTVVEVPLLYVECHAAVRVALGGRIAGIVGSLMAEVQVRASA